MNLAFFYLLVSETKKKFIVYPQNIHKNNKILNLRKTIYLT